MKAGAPHEEERELIRVRRQAENLRADANFIWVLKNAGKVAVGSADRKPYCLDLESVVPSSEASINSSLESR